MKRAKAGSNWLSMTKFTPTSVPGDRFGGQRIAWRPGCPRTPVGIIFEYFVEGSARSEKFENIGHADAHASNAGTATTLSVVDGNSIQAFGMHALLFINLQFRVWGTRGRMRFLAVSCMGAYGCGEICRGLRSAGRGGVCGDAGVAEGVTAFRGIEESTSLSPIFCHRFSVTDFRHRFFSDFCHGFFMGKFISAHVRASGGVMICGGVSGAVSLWSFTISFGCCFGCEPYRHAKLRVNSAPRKKICPE